MPDFNNVKRGKTYFGSWFQRTQTMVAAHSLGQNIMLVGACGGGAFSSHG
jgi:hypothetical protein